MKDITVLIHTSGNRIEEDRTLKTVSGWVKRVEFVRESSVKKQMVKAGWVLELKAGEEVSIPLKIELRELTESADISRYEIPLVVNYTDVWKKGSPGRECFYRAQHKNKGVAGGLKNPIRSYIRHGLKKNALGNTSVNNILVIKMRGIGDTVLATPVFKNLRLRFPRAKIIALVKKESLSVLDGNRNLNGVLAYDGFLKTLIKLRKEKYDLALCAQAGFSSALLAKLSGARILSVNNHNGRNYFSSVLVDKPEEYENAVERDLDCLRALGLPVVESKPEVYVCSSEVARAEKTFKALGIKRAVKVIGINPSASKENKRWGKERYAELADRLMELQAFSVLFFTDPLNKTLIPEITGMMKNKAAVIGAKSIREVSGVISKLSLYIGNDSGLSHIAAGLNTPTITIVGPDEAAIFHPYPRGERHFIVSKDVSCKPCWKENCDKGNTCLDKVTVNEVYKVVEKWKKLAR